MNLFMSTTFFRFCTTGNYNSDSFNSKLETSYLNTPSVWYGAYASYILTFRK